MSYSDIVASVERLNRKYGESDPAALCSLIGIKLNLRSMGTASDAVKGFFLTDRRIRVITVNSDMPEVIQRIITAHEIGHAVLHRNAGLHTFHDVSVFNESSVLEKEANLFAAEYHLAHDLPHLAHDLPHLAHDLEEESCANSSEKHEKSCQLALPGLLLFAYSCAESQKAPYCNNFSRWVGCKKRRTPIVS